MDIKGITYVGPMRRDSAVLDKLPDSLRNLLSQINGFILFGGALHVRGACGKPDWHSLDAVWSGEGAFHHNYPSVSAAWVPFAEDCVGDQFFLDEGHVVHLLAETGDIEATGMGLTEFLKSVQSDPVKTLSAQPLLQFLEENGELQAGQLINAYPPFCTEEARDGVRLSAVPALQQHRVNALLARSWPQEGDGIAIKVVD